MIEPIRPNFNPRSSCEERRDPTYSLLVTSEFQSTLLMRGATAVMEGSASIKIFQSTLLMRGATLSSILSTQTMIFQSTLLMRGATYPADNFSGVGQFQSTLLMRGATWSGLLSRSTAYFNPRSSCEERRPPQHGVYRGYPISIHAPHARSDTSQCLVFAGASQRFQSTLLMRGATVAASLRALSCRHFNPRSSCEERLHRQVRYDHHARISIHAPHARSDGYEVRRTAQYCDFNPRSSCEERHNTSTYTPTEFISIHAPHARSDRRPPQGQDG